MSDHTAAAAAIGYLYQCDWALLALLRGYRENPDWRICLELYDDVSWDEEGSPRELLEVKHHLRSARTLGDLDVDVWRTIGLWLDAGSVAESDAPLLTLVTTQIASAGSAMAALRAREDRVDHEAALIGLERAARQSNAEATKRAREAFLALDPLTRELFVKRMRLLDGEPLISDIPEKVRVELQFSLPFGHEDAAMQFVWGWWRNRVLQMLQATGDCVGAVEVHQFLDDMRSHFERADLPTYDDLKGPESGSEYLDMVFVHQLRWVAVPQTILETAISDYYRAYAHVAKWNQDDLIGADEMTRFEARLRDEWKRAFAFAIADLKAEASEDDKRRVGRALLQTTLERAEPRIRERYREPFFARGVHHSLANERQLGWHPDFERKLEELLLLDQSA